jgi:hypothetical protein
MICPAASVRDRDISVGRPSAQALVTAKVSRFGLLRSFRLLHHCEIGIAG